MSTSESVVKVMLVDDHILVLEGIRARLEQEKGIDVVGQATDGLEALKRVKDLKPDVIMMDVSMPNMNGIETTKIFQERYPDLKVLILTMHERLRRALIPHGNNTFHHNFGNQNGAVDVQSKAQQDLAVLGMPAIVNGAVRKKVVRGNTGRASGGAELTNRSHYSQLLRTRIIKCSHNLCIAQSTSKPRGVTTRNKQGRDVLSR